MIDKSQGDLNSSNSKYFPLCPPSSISIALLLFEVSTSILCVLISQSPSLNPICFRSFAAPVAWFCLEIAVLQCTLPSWFQSSNHFSKPPELLRRLRDSLPTQGLAMTALPWLAAAALSGLSAAWTSCWGCIRLQSVAIRSPAEYPGICCWST